MKQAPVQKKPDAPPGSLRLVAGYLHRKGRGFDTEVGYENSNPCRGISDVCYNRGYA
ncbi:hypothetical protein [Armatimonas sp.]|uniref:hypothetical protein n=1 Tax=Armatimonas sp. TaxID=1872638 RepID=UPI0037522C1C